MDRKPIHKGLLIFLVLGLFLFLGVYLATFAIEGGFPGDARIALIRIEGPILDSQKTIQEILRYKEDPSIKAIVLRIDSPKKTPKSTTRSTFPDTC